MKDIIKYHFLFYLILGLSTVNCKEEIDIESVAGFESALVVEARITNEYKFHEINISSSKNFDNGDFPTVSNAHVRIETDDKIIYDFNEISPGKYISNEAFIAEANRKYQLFIDTNDGDTYSSSLTELTKVTQIDDLTVTSETNSYGTEGIAINVHSFDETGNSRYYKYEYEESYKIIAPNATYQDLILDEFNNPKLIRKANRNKVCYKTDHSFHIIQHETTGLNQDKVSDFTARFISRANPIISHRYSILVKQFVQSLEGYTYFNTLNELSGSGNVFSQNQPGFFSGNIKSIQDTSKKVIGYFEVSSVSSKRIFFNYADYFPNETLPPYFIDCEMTAPDARPDIGGGPSPLETTIRDDFYLFYLDNWNYPMPEAPWVGPYLFVRPACGDCTKIGSLEIPDFWEE